MKVNKLIFSSVVIGSVGMYLASIHGFADSKCRPETPVLKLIRIEPNQSPPDMPFGTPVALVRAASGNLSCVESFWNIGIAVLIIENTSEREIRIPFLHECWKLKVFHPVDRSTTYYPIVDQGVSNRSPERRWPESSIILKAHESFAILIGLKNAQRISLDDEFTVECSASGMILKSNSLSFGDTNRLRIEMSPLWTENSRNLAKTESIVATTKVRGLVIE